MIEYNMIKEFYGDRTTARSKIPLINHINEGLFYLHILGASDLAKRAFCLHPIVQNNEDVDCTGSLAYDLACEYRDKANSYLCKPETDWVKTIDDVKSLVGVMSDDCVDMLLADKMQNQKDFYLYHHDTHERSKELADYFNLWLNFLVDIIPKNNYITLTRAKTALIGLYGK